MSTRRVRPWSLICLLVVTAGLLGVACSGDGGNGPSDAEVAAARETTYDLLDGGSSSLVNHTGRPVVVNFFGSWCAPCVSEMPDFEQVHQEFGDEVTFVGLNIIDTPKAARGIVTQTGVTYEIGFDPGERIYQLFHSIGAPTTVVLDANGTVSDTHTGPLGKADLRDMIADAISR